LAYAIESRTGQGYIHGKLIGLCTVIVSILQSFSHPSPEHKYLLRDDSSLSDEEWIAAAVNVMVRFETPSKISTFLKQCGLDCFFGPQNGNPTISEVLCILSISFSFTI
jgi:hypothetical protein